MNEAAQLKRVRHVVLDMDGTIYVGGKLFEATRPFLAYLSGRGLGYTFVTNNSSHSRADYLTRLQRLSVPVTADQMCTSTHATVDYLRLHLPAVKRLFVLGTPSLQQELVEMGFVLADRTAKTPPDAVVAGFDTTLTFDRLCEAAWWIMQGKAFIATHPDFTCPTNEPTVLVDCGSICKALEAATGVSPVTIGKPDPLMVEGLCHRHGVSMSELAIVGDRLMTDMAMARRCGATGVLVLTGEATREQAERSQWRPDLIVSDLGELQRMMAGARP